MHIYENYHDPERFTFFQLKLTTVKRILGKKYVHSTLLLNRYVRNQNKE
jgi:hypothetical protein